MAPLRVCSVLWLVLGAVPYIASDEDLCTPVEGSKCSCVYPNGTGIDLKGVQDSDFIRGKSFKLNADTSFEMDEYMFHPCKDKPVAVDTPTNLCTHPVAICRHRRTLSVNKNTTKYNETELYENFGVNSKVQFTPDGRALIYDNSPSGNMVMLQCAPLADADMLYIRDSEPNNVQLTYISRHACLQQLVEVSHRSTGSTLLIIFFSVLLFYVVLGVGTKKFLMGAQGLEVVPNLSFWLDLPNLVKEGWCFLCSGCRVPARGATGPTATPDPNSYDSI